MTITAYLSLGSNLGNREENLRRAVDLLKSLGRIAAVSSFYETQPIEVAEAQPWFVNCVVALETALGPHDLLGQTLAMERALGRRRGLPKAPRSVDIDIVLYGDTILNDEVLTVPHTAMHRRRFVLEPLAEIAPDAEHPVLRKTAAELLRALPLDGSQVHKLG